MVVFDLETSGLPRKISFAEYYPYTQNEYYDSSRILSLAFAEIRLGNVDDLERINVHSYFRKPENFAISEESFKVHKLSTEFLSENGKEMHEILNSSALIDLFNRADYILSHNILFDFNILCNEMSRLGIKVPEDWTSKLACSCKMASYKRLGDLYQDVVQKKAENLHNAAGDVQVLLEILNRLQG
jgi:DNA polymerase-3 subunit epsilon